MNNTSYLDSLDFFPITANLSPPPKMRTTILTPTQKKAGHIILKKWRYKQLQQLTTTPLSDRQALALTMKKRNLKRVCTQETIPRPEKGIYAINPEKAKTWVEAHPPEHQATAKQFLASLTYKSHAKFEKQLRLTINDFNRHLLSYPVDQRNYAIYVDSVDALNRSEGWVQLLALKYLLTDTLMAITNRIDSLATTPDIILICDDGAYSGSQMWHTASKLVPIADVFIAVPFVSQKAKAYILSAKDPFKKNKLRLCAHQIMPTFNELNFTRNPKEEVKLKLASVFRDKCATIFNHKIADGVSIPNQIIRRGYLITFKSAPIIFVDHPDKLPPYKAQSKL